MKFLIFLVFVLLGNHQLYSQAKASVMKNGSVVNYGGVNKTTIINNPKGAVYINNHYYENPNKQIMKDIKNLYKLIKDLSKNNESIQNELRNLNHKYDSLLLLFRSYETSPLVSQNRIDTLDFYKTNVGRTDFITEFNEVKEISTQLITLTNKTPDLIQNKSIDSITTCLTNEIEKVESALLKNLDIYSIYSRNQNNTSHFFSRIEYENANITDPNFYTDTFLKAVKKSNKYGFTDRNNELFIDYKYDYASNFFDGIAIVMNNETWALLNIFDSIIYTFPSEVRKVSKPSNSRLFIVETVDKQWLADKSGIPISEEFTKIHLNGLEDYFVVENNKKFGLISNNGITLVPCKYERIAPFIEDVFEVQLLSKVGLIRKNGKEILPCEFNSFKKRSDGFYVAVSKANLNSYLEFRKSKPRGLKLSKRAYQATHDVCYFLDRSFNISKRAYNDIYESNPFGIITVKNKYWGFIDSTGKEILACNLLDIKYLKNGYIVKNQNGQFSLVNFSLNKLSKTYYENIFEYDSNLLQVKKNGLYGLINHQGDILLEPISIREIKPYDKTPFVELFTSNSHVLWDSKSKKTVLYSESEIEPIRHNMIKSGGRYFYLSHNKKLHELRIPYGDEIIIPYSCQFINDSLKSGLTVIKSLDQFHNGFLFLDTIEHIILDQIKNYQLTNMNHFLLDFGRTHILFNTKYELLYQSEEKIVPGDNSYLVVEDYKVGYIDSNCMEMIPFKYLTDSKPFVKDLAIIHSDKGWGVINRNGLEIIPSIFEQVYQFDDHFRAVRNGVAYKVDFTGNCYSENSDKYNQLIKVHSE